MLGDMQGLEETWSCPESQTDSEGSALLAEVGALGQKRTQTGLKASNISGGHTSWP